MATQNRNFEAGFFSEEPLLRDSWAGVVDKELIFLSDRYWHIPDGGALHVPKAVGTLVLGVVEAYPEFRGIGSTYAQGSLEAEEDEIPTVSFFSLIAKSGVHFYDQDAVATRLIEATNNQLLALGSPYNLPILPQSSL